MLLVISTDAHAGLVLVRLLFSLLLAALTPPVPNRLVLPPFLSPLHWEERVSGSRTHRPVILNPSALTAYFYCVFLPLRGHLVSSKMRFHASIIIGGSFLVSLVIDDWVVCKGFRWTDRKVWRALIWERSSLCDIKENKSYKKNLNFSFLHSNNNNKLSIEEINLLQKVWFQWKFIIVHTTQIFYTIYDP